MNCKKWSAHILIQKSECSCWAGRNFGLYNIYQNEFIEYSAPLVAPSVFEIVEQEIKKIHAAILHLNYEQITCQAICILSHEDEIYQVVLIKSNSVLIQLIDDEAIVYVVTTVLLLSFGLVKLGFTRQQKKKKRFSNIWLLVCRRDSVCKVVHQLKKPSFSDKKFYYDFGHSPRNGRHTVSIKPFSVVRFCFEKMLDP